MNGSLTWFWLSLFFALWTSIGISIAKKILIQKVHPLLFILVNLVSTIPFMIALILLTGGIPQIQPKFYILITLDGILDTVASVASTTAISIAPISLISPISSFNPVFTTIIAAVTIGEIPSFIKSIGIITVVIGAYLLNISDIRDGILLPFRKLFTNKGVLLFLLANFIWGITPIIQKQAIFQTEPPKPLFVAFFGTVLISIFIFSFVLVKVRDIREQIIILKRNWKWFATIAPFGSLAVWAAFTAFSLAPLGLVTSVFKLSVLFTILWGFLFFKEERIWERLLGAAVMILGTLLLVR